jgi:hypothetical protein
MNFLQSITQNLLQVLLHHNTTESLQLSLHHLQSRENGQGGTSSSSIRKMRCLVVLA